MKRPGEKSNEGRITRRGTIFLGIQFGIIGILGWRMQKLQVEESESYFLLAEENRINIRLLPPQRGLIFDRAGVPIAVNRQNYKITMVREQAGDVDEILDRLGTLIEVDEEAREQVKREMKRRSAFVPVTVVEQLSWEEFSRVSVNAPALPGIITEVGLTRNYPLGPGFAHVVGYVGPVSENDLKKLANPDPVLQIPKFQIGKTGIEKVNEDRLRGLAGNSQIEVNSAGRVMRELQRNDGTPGEDLHLTLDAGLQNFALERMGSQSASTVVIDTTNGDVLCMVAAPGFDPNKFVLGISSKDWKGLLNNEYRPLSNKPVTGGYPPGSTIKPVIAMAVLKADVIDPEETVFCPGFYVLGGRRFHCWKRSGHGKVNLRKAMQQSCDVYFYEVSRRTGIERIAEMARRFGIGIEHELPLPGVSPGIMPDAAWKRRNRGESWYPGDTIITGIGQGFMLASPLNLAIMAARVASGREIKPRLIRAVNGVPVPSVETPDMGLAADDLDRVRDGMYAVSNTPRGTAYRSRIDDKEFALAGKTGTSQVRNITAEERSKGVIKEADLPWAARDHALFIAYAPYDKPKYAMTVIVDHGGGGSKVAAPIARDVMMYALYGPKPPLKAYPAGERNAIKKRRAAEEQSEPEPVKPLKDRA